MEKKIKDHINFNYLSKKISKKLLKKHSNLDLNDMNKIFSYFEENNLNNLKIDKKLEKATLEFYFLLYQKLKMKIDKKKGREIRKKFIYKYTFPIENNNKDIVIKKELNQKKNISLQDEFENEINEENVINNERFDANKFNNENKLNSNIFEYMSLNSNNFLDYKDDDEITFQNIKKEKKVFSFGESD